MVLISNGVGLIIEFWKLQKAFNFRVLWVTGAWLPRLSWGNPQGQTHVQEQAASDGKTLAVTVPSAEEAATAAAMAETEKHDAVATTHLLYVVGPLMLGYAAYSYLHLLHKSYYSWVVSSLVGFVYAFGFVLMTPQIYINYRLKSVAHMPWKAMVYKSLNTFIDDLFAFVVKMPALHRAACLRDDLIFFVYLYQRWAYPVDLARVNEYGQESGTGSAAPTTTTGAEGEAHVAPETETEGEAKKLR